MLLAMLLVLTATAELLGCHAHGSGTGAGAARRGSSTVGGQVVSTVDGCFFCPVRPDLDTIVSRIDSALVENITVIKGPYTVRRGLGFSFIDIETLGTPRYESGFEGHGSTSIGYTAPPRMSQGSGRPRRR